MGANTENLIRFASMLVVIALQNGWIITFGHNDEGTGLLVVCSDLDDSRAYVETTHDEIDRDPYGAAQSVLDAMLEARPRGPYEIN